MNTDWTSLLPFLAALKRQPDTPWPDGDGDPTADESDGGGAVLGPLQTNGGAAALSQSNLIGDKAPSVAQGASTLQNKGQLLAQLLQSGLQGSNPNQAQQAQPQPTPPELQPPPLFSRDPIESIRGMIANVAGSKKGSTDYLLDQSKDGYGAGSPKCNKFVADSIEESGLPRPQAPYKNEGVVGRIDNMLGRSRDPSTNDWANPNVKIPGWSEPRPLSEARLGDVIAQQHGDGGHAGVLVYGDKGELATASSNTAQAPKGIVTVNNWGFRPRLQNGESEKDPFPIVRHYLGK